ncbi:MAG: SIMPL domain-containing protein [bacterium]|nr:SIMPL domain-containing protein [bacterium]
MNTRVSSVLIVVLQAILIASLSTAAVVVVTRLLGGPALSISQITTNKQTTFDVTGESKVSTVPDQAEVTLGIAVTETTVKAAQDRANTIINGINEQLGSLGIEKKDIRTENYSLYPNYDYQSGNNQRITGYTVNANLVVTMTDFAKLNQAIDLATGAGANQIGGITFSLSDDKKSETEETARKEAIENAKDKAQELSSLAGMRLGKIINVYETPADSGVYPQMFRDAAMAEGAGGGAPTNVEPGSTNFVYTVTLSYETL